jgi:hypothetical protein
MDSLVAYYINIIIYMLYLAIVSYFLFLNNHTYLYQLECALGCALGYVLIVVPLYAWIVGFTIKRWYIYFSLFIIPALIILVLVRFGLINTKITQYVLNIFIYLILYYILHTNGIVM